MSLSIPNFSKAQVLVVGDLMLDRYWQGPTSRISPEAPVPVVHINDMRECAGGAGNVALNITALGAKASLLGVVGRDEAGKTIEQILTTAKVDCHFAKLPVLPTITKLRILSRHQQLMRLDFEEKLHDISAELLVPDFTELLTTSQAVILSDYNKGTLVDVQEFINLANAKQIPIFIDPKGDDFTKYRGATLLTPNFKEFETIVGRCYSEVEIESKAQALVHQLNLQALLITRSEKGMTLIEKNRPAITIPTQARDVFDVTGAGDTVIGVLAASVAAGQSLPQAMVLANLAAGLVVAKSGAATVTISELRQAMTLEREPHPIIVNEQQLLNQRQQAKARQETVVMTNGCFDILHAGHMTYLEEAKALGDYLIVAVNDDASVQALKGPSRPINPLSERMKVLAGLKAVDFVVAFSETTPQRLIEKILPDVLVKGGDYKVAEIAGARAVMEHGGTVKILSFKDGCSTSGIIRRIQEQA